MTTVRSTWQIDHPDEGKTWTSGPGGSVTRVTEPLRLRVWGRIDRRGIDDCWPWTGSTNRRGYGHISVDGKMVRVTRLVFYWEHGYWPNECCHTCDWPLCCNNAAPHLLDGTHSDNQRDVIERGFHWRASLAGCQRGHAWTEESTGRDSGGRRYCKICKRLRERSHPTLGARRPYRWKA